jgi:hypothetical protein
MDVASRYCVEDRYPHLGLAYAGFESFVMRTCSCSAPNVAQTSHPQLLRAAQQFLYTADIICDFSDNDFMLRTSAYAPEHDGYSEPHHAP